MHTACATVWRCRVRPLAAPVRPCITRPHQCQLVCACLIWDGCSFEACDWLPGRLFCLQAIFPSIRGFLFRAPSPLPLGPVLLHVDAHRNRIKTLAHTSLHRFYRGLFRADSCTTLHTSTLTQRKSTAYKHVLPLKTPTASALRAARVTFPVWQLE